MENQGSKLPNIFPDFGTLNLEVELFEVLAGNENIRIERIVSQGHASPEGFWYDQPTDEWVILLQGKARIFFETDGETELITGNYLLIPAHKKHRVTYTSMEPACVWLAVYGIMT